MRTIGKIIVDLLSDNHISDPEAEMLITNLSENKEPLDIISKKVSSPYWYQTTT
tara:strand:- start:563 stop:724 length:162 start_codon:yes stop_codon:yes gene_type:complete